MKSAISKYLTAMENYDAPGVEPVAVVPPVTEVTGSPDVADQAVMANGAQGAEITEVNPGVVQDNAQGSSEAQLQGTDAVISQEQPLPVEAVEPPAGVVVADGVTTLDVVEAVPEAADAITGCSVAERQMLEQRADDLLAVQTSLESYSRLIRDAGIDGISQQTAAFMKVGLEHIESVLGIKKITVGMEGYNSAEPRTAILKAAVSQESLKEYATKAYERFIEIIKKLIEGAFKAVEHYRTGISELEKYVKSLIKYSERLKGNPEVDSINIKSAKFIAIDGELNLRRSIDAVMGVAHWSAYEYTKSFSAYLEKMAGYVRAFRPENGDAAKVISQLKGLKGPVDVKGTAKTALPGGYKFVIDEDYMGFNIARDEGIKDMPDDLELDISTIAQIKKYLADMANVIGVLLNTRTQYKKVKDAGDKLTKSIDDLGKRVKDQDYTKADRDEADKVITEALTMVRDVNPHHDEVIQWLVRTTKVHLKVLQVQMLAFTTEGK